ncbi:pre-mRNA splicing factor component-domain-containing protein [Blastocladiella britannica]|nr:pre-mRNA splicing factor component-domain-containing protein [Blastocladiella britannica]
MRVVIKGGVWKNTEDEVLKVAVMKYGKNQWARISSLLTRKTPKQCKARWYEWLDPSIKKTEWAKDEDEKLLHLAKLMPTQWRTIAPIIGRTPAQCLDRYQKLLDEAERELAGSGFGGASSSAAAASAAAAAAAGGFGAVTDDAGPSSDEVRRLRPGEIDPDPETKPARPDPVDMDEDEKEMLSEARARLANTQGKKAKRKARERQLEESRRLAALQKRRELKASGIKFQPRRTQGDDVDYIRDVPFQRMPLPGFYDATAELNKKSGLDFAEVLLSRVEGKRKAEREEAAQRRDAKRRRVREDEGGISFVSAGGAAAAAIFNREEFSATRAALTLPAPQLTEADIDTLAKRGATQVPVDADGGVASDLVSEYGSATPRTVIAPTRTQRDAVADSVRAHARALLQAKDLQTPLLGQDSAHVATLPQSSSILPPSQTPRTARTDVNGGAATPRTSASATPYRDSMGINTPLRSVAGTPRVAGPGAGRAALRNALAALPKPRNEFTLVLPEAATDGTGSTKGAPKPSARLADAADEDAAQAQELAADSAAREAMMSTVVRHGLPRPTLIPTADALMASSPYPPGSSMHAAEAMIAREMVRLMRYEALEVPVAGAPPVGSNDNDDELEIHVGLTPEAIETAHQIIADSVTVDLDSLDLSAVFAEEFEETGGFSVLDPVSGVVYASTEVDASTYDGDTEGSVPTWASIYASTSAAVSAAAQQGVKLEKQLKVQFGGYTARAGKLHSRLTAATDETNRLADDLAALQGLRQAEVAAAPMRLAEVRRDVEMALREERELQERYAELARALAAVDDA